MKNLRIAVVLAALIAGCAKAPVRQGFDWPRWRGPNGDGISKETDWNPRALTGGAKILWTRDVGVGYSDVVIQGNRLYTMGNTGENKEKLTCQCLDAGTGMMVWRRHFGTGIIEPRSTPAIDGERIYGLFANGTLLCLRAGNGKVLWKKNLNDDFDTRMARYGWSPSPVVEGDLLLLNASSAQIALDKKTGELKWSIADTELPGSWGSFTTAMMADFQGTRCAAFLGPSTLNVVEASTGKKLWSYPNTDTSHPISDPIVFENQTFIQLLYSCTLLESAGAEPRVVWSTNSFCNASFPTPVLVAGYLYGTHWPREYYVNANDWASMRRLDFPFRCVEWKTGRVIWEKSMKAASVISANGKLIMLEVTGTLRIAEASPASYQELSSTDVLMGANKPRIFAVPPVLCNGKIYCRNFAGDLVCIDVSS